MKKPTLKTPNLRTPDFKAPNFKALGGSRTGTSLLAGAVVLGAVFGIAELRPPVDPAAKVTGSPTTAQVERTSLVCPQPTQGLTGSTSLSLFTPAGGEATGGYGALLDVAPHDPVADAPAAGSPSPGATPTVNPADVPPSDARVALAKPGIPVAGPAFTGDNAPGTTAVGTGSYAPGFTVTQLTTVNDQQGLGISGINCTPSDTSFWFSGASTAGDRVDYVSLVNAESVAAVVDLRFYGEKGPIEVEAADGIALGPGTSQGIRLPSLIKDQKDLAIHVVARSGRIGAGLHAADGNKGADWVPAAGEPAPVQVLPGLPGDAGAYLVIAAPGEDDADLKIQISGKNGWFTPAGFETVHVKAGMVTSVPLGKITRDEPGAVRLSPTDENHPTPVIATMRTDRAHASGKSDAAWISGATPVGKRASVADNRGGGATTLYLTSTGEAATVKITASAGSGGGTPAEQEIAIPAGATVSLPSPEPAGLNGSFGLTLQTLTGGPVAAARMLAIPAKDVPMFTVQPFHDDRSTVTVPNAAANPAVLVR